MVTVSLEPTPYQAIERALQDNVKKPQQNLETHAYYK
jgi:hypothetical protein